jgi:hypothetical protein
MPGWEWDHYKETVPMSTYLVAFIISDLHSLDATMTNLSTSENNFRLELPMKCRLVKYVNLGFWRLSLYFEDVIIFQYVL